MGDVDFGAMRQAVVDGDEEGARKLAEDAVAASADLVAAVEQGFAAGIREVGDLWEEGEYFLPELVQGAEAMKAAMAVIGPSLSEGEGIESRGKVVLGTVAGDLHDIGKSLVGTLLSAYGFEVHDLGTDVSLEAFVDKAREVGADLVGASALLTTTMATQRQLVEAVSSLPGPPKVMVGGAPTSTTWAESIGAHHAENALQAVALAEKLVG